MYRLAGRRQRLGTKLNCSSESLDEAIDLALEKSYEARRQYLQLRVAEKANEAAVARSGINVSLQLDAPNFKERVQEVRVPNELPSYNTTGTLDWRGQLSVRRSLPTGGELTFTPSINRRRDTVFDDALQSSEKDRTFFSSLSIGLRQPLFVPNARKLDLEQAKLQMEQAQRVFTRTQLDLVYQVTREFYSYYRDLRAVNIARAELKQLEDSYELALRKFEAGLIPEGEALQMEVDLDQSRNALLEAEGTLTRQVDQFKLTLGLRMGDDVTVATDFVVVDFDVDEAVAIEHGLRHRADVRESEITRRLAEIRVREVDAETAIRGDISASYDRTGVSDPGLPFSTSTGALFESSWENLQDRPENFGIQFALTVPIWDSGLNQARVSGARASLDQSKLSAEHRERLVRQQIRGTIAQLHEARNRLDALQKSEGVALRNFEISVSRFDRGDITGQELALDRDRLTRTRQSYLDAYIQYQLAIADLKRQTLYDFEHNRSLVKPAG